MIIIGAGKIGAFFDSPGDTSVLTHAHAFSRHPGFRLAGFVDRDLSTAEKAAHIWGGGAFKTVAQALEQHVDVAVISTPDEDHYPVLKELVNYPLRFVFAEKPLSYSLAEADEIVSAYEARGIPLAVNYTRRYASDFANLRNRIRRNEFGPFLTGSGYYGKGARHNGSHMIDLIRFLLGEIETTVPLGSIIDWSAADPTCSAWMELTSGGQIALLAADCRNFTIFDLDLLFGGQRIRITDSGHAIEYFGVTGSDRYAGYQILTGARRHETDLSLAFLRAADNCYRHLTAGDPIVCTAQDGLTALRLCARIQSETSTCEY